MARGAQRVATTATWRAAAGCPPLSKPVCRPHASSPALSAPCRVSPQSSTAPARPLLLAPAAPAARRRLPPHNAARRGTRCVLTWAADTHAVCAPHGQSCAETALPLYQPLSTSLRTWAVSLGAAATLLTSVGTPVADAVRGGARARRWTTRPSLVFPSCPLTPHCAPWQVPRAQEVFQVAGLGVEPVKVRHASGAAALTHRPGPSAADSPVPAADVQNARALLRNALPIKNKQIRVAQQALESITDDLRVPGVRFSVRPSHCSTSAAPGNFPHMSAG